MPVISNSIPKVVGVAVPNVPNVLVAVLVASAILSSIVVAVLAVVLLVVILIFVLSVPFFAVLGCLF